MSSKCFMRLFMLMVVSVGLTGMAGCKEKSVEGVKPKTASVSPAMVRSLPTVTLTGTKIQENTVGSGLRVEIKASGIFGSNVVAKSNPECIIVIIHNATKGNAPPAIEVNNGTINRVQIAQLDTGKGPAVRIIIGLDRAAQHVVTPVLNGLFIDVLGST